MLQPLSGLFLLATLAVGCGPSQITLKLQGGEKLNLDPLTGEYSPVVVCAYFTVTRDQIQNVSFEDIWAKEGARVREILQKDFVSRAVPVDVNVNRNNPDWTLSTGDGANFVTIVARFNKVEGSDWKKTMDFNQAQASPIRFDGYAIQVVQPRP